MRTDRWSNSDLFRGRSGTMDRKAFVGFWGAIVGLAWDGDGGEGLGIDICHVCMHFFGFRRVYPILSAQVSFKFVHQLSNSLSTRSDVEWVVISSDIYFVYHNLAAIIDIYVDVRIWSSYERGRSCRPKVCHAALYAIVQFPEYRFASTCYHSAVSPSLPVLFCHATAPS